MNVIRCRIRVAILLGFSAYEASFAGFNGDGNHVAVPTDASTVFKKGAQRIEEKTLICSINAQRSGDARDA